MPLTENDIQAFLNAQGWGDAKRNAMTADASFRSYERLTHAGSGQRAILMKAPPSTNAPISEFTRVTDILRGHNLSAPEIFAQDDAQGLMLLEDLGDALFARLCEQGADETALYAAAVDVLAELHLFAAPKDIPPYDRATYLREASLLIDWYLPTATGAALSSSLTREFANLIIDATDKLMGTEPVLVLRDYHAENLIHLPDRIGAASVGLLDYQDALAGHPAYDLVSLLEDARRDTSKDLQLAMIQRYLAARQPDLDAFKEAYAILGAQRNIKIIGIFARLCLRDGKARYLDMIPRVWMHLQRDLTHPSLRHLADWMAAHVPAPNDDILDRLRAAKAS